MSDVRNVGVFGTVRQKSLPVSASFVRSGLTEMLHLMVRSAKGDQIFLNALSTVRNRLDV